MPVGCQPGRVDLDGVRSPGLQDSLRAASRLWGFHGWDGAGGKSEVGEGLVIPRHPI